jgi:hypothetical protein
VVLVAADAVGVAADPEALGGGDQGEGADAAVTAGVPGQGQAVDRVEGGDALAGDRAGPARSAAKLLFIQRWWPPTWTAVPVMATLYRVSPPVSQRVAESHRLSAR